MVNFSLLFLFVSVALGIALVVYLVYVKPPTVDPICRVSTECAITEVCQSGHCQEQICHTDKDCATGGRCLGKYCFYPRCQSGSDCPAGAACLNGICVPVGATCQGNSDCRGLSCLNGKCGQCSSTTSCPSGQGCFSSICRYPGVGESQPAYLTYISAARLIGNITAPDAYLCPEATCGSRGDQISCSGTGACPSSCPYCVNDVCRCTPGVEREICRQGSDCQSTTCGDIGVGQNKYCLGTGGQCLNNYQGGTLACPASDPYCVEGKCSKVSLGAVCNTLFAPADVCRDPSVLGLSGATGVTPNGMGFFCVEGRCRSMAGEYNQRCTGNSCLYFSDQALVCNADQGRCLPA